MCRDNRELTLLVQHAQEIFGRTISHVEQELIINMVTYYGLPCDVVLVTNPKRKRAEPSERHTSLLWQKGGARRALLPLRLPMNS